jgi:mannose-1-phosphate guanylyltransferase/mannose-6-phosphate isomerase
MNNKSIIYPVILSGGIGTRLWPLSRKLHPKQFHRFTNDKTFLQQTVQRFSGLGFGETIVVCNSDHRFLVADQLRTIGLQRAQIVLEPIGKNTAPAAIITAMIIQEKYSGGLMLITPSDHSIQDEEAMCRAIKSATEDAINGSFIVFGVLPVAPNTGFGYIKSNTEKLKGGARKVETFVEKPTAEKAELFIQQGTYYWNSGIFFCDSKSLIEEMEIHEPEMVELCRQALKSSSNDLDFLRLNVDVFSKLKGKSLDYALMEKTTKAAMIPIDVSWNDVGSWQALWEDEQKDEKGNVVTGSVVAINSTNNYLHSNGPLLGVSEIEDLVVVATEDAVLVVPRSQSESVKELVKAVEKDGFQAFNKHVKVQRPWGSYEVLHVDSGYQVKKLTLKPNSAISLQYHKKRAEHWVVVAGNAKVNCDEMEIILKANQSTYIPLGSKHRLTNNGTDELVVIEVQTGNYLGEDDIIRLEDIYGRDTP